MATDTARGRFPAAALVALGAAAVMAHLAASGAAAGMVGGVGLLAVLALGCDLPRQAGAVADATDWGWFLLGLCVAALPLRSAVPLALLPLAVIPLRRRDGAAGQGAALLLCGLAFAAVIEGQGGALIAPPILATEARLVGGMLGALDIPSAALGNTLALPEAGRMLVILRGCSLLAVLPPLLLAAVALARLMAPERLPSPIRLCGMAALAVVINTLRLAATAVSDVAARFFHAPEGEALLQALWLCLALAAALPVGRRT
jgi:hypothetical protein